MHILYPLRFLINFSWFIPSLRHRVKNSHRLRWPWEKWIVQLTSLHSFVPMPCMYNTTTVRKRGWGIDREWEHKIKEIKKQCEMKCHCKLNAVKYLLSDLFKLSSTSIKVDTITEQRTNAISVIFAYLLIYFTYWRMSYNKNESHNKMRISTQGAFNHY